jgi:hypothetical protein
MSRDPRLGDSEPLLIGALLRPSLWTYCPGNRTISLVLAPTLSGKQNPPWKAVRPSDDWRACRPAIVFIENNPALPSREGAGFFRPALAACSAIDLYARS